MPIGLIASGVNVDGLNPDVATFSSASLDDLRSRWVSVEAHVLLIDWERSRFDRSLIERKIGKLHGKLDLRGIPLGGKDLSRANLSDCDFYGGQFRGARLVAVNMDRSYFSEADIRGADLSWSSARGTFFDNVQFDSRTVMLGIPLHSVNFNLAALLYDQAKTEQRVAHLKRRSPIFAKFLEISCDYGRSLSRWGTWVIIIVALFSLVFYIIRDQCSGIKNIFDSFYFAVVTFTTLGFGDIVPVTLLSRMVTLADVSLGYIMGGLLVSILGRRVFGD